MSYPASTNVSITKIGNTDTSPYKSKNHPNGINVGYNSIGILKYPVTVGFRVLIEHKFRTSVVTKIIDKNHFHTQNSIYEIKQIEQ